MSSEERHEEEPGQARYRRAILRAAVVFFVVLLLLTFFSRTILTLSLPHVTVAEPTSGALLRQIRAEGTIASTERSELYVDTRRKVVEAKVRVGDAVRSGQILLVLDAGDLQPDLSQALVLYGRGGTSLDDVLAPLATAHLKTLDSAINLARMNVENLTTRVSNLRDLQTRGVESAEAVSRARLELSQAEQDLSERQDARDQRRDSLLKDLRSALVLSPVDAMVTSVASGWVDPSQPVVRLLPRGAGLELVVTVSLDQSKLLSIGETVEVSARGGSERRADASITRISETSSTGGGYRELTLAIPRESDLRAGDAAELSIQKQTRVYALLVPNAALGRDSQGPFVWVLKERSGVLGSESYVIKSNVVTEDSDDFMTAISSGLDPTEKVVVRSTKPLSASGGRVVVE